jgi:hypothetical protein
MRDATLKITKASQVLEAHTCNSIYSRGKRWTAVQGQPLNKKFVRLLFNRKARHSGTICGYQALGLGMWYKRDSTW